MFSLLEVASRPLSKSIHPLPLLSMRFIIGGLILLPWALKEARAAGALKIEALWRIALLSFLGINISMGLLQWSLLYAPAAVAATFISSTPAFVPIFSWLILGQKPEKGRLATIFLGLTGVLIIGIGEATIPSGAMAGLLLALGASICFALYTVLGSALTRKYGRVSVLGFGALMGGLVFSPFLIVNPPASGFAALIAVHWHRLLILGVLVSGVGYILYFRGMEILGPNRGASFFFLKPALATVLGIFLLGEKPSVIQVMGICLVSAAVLLTGFSRKVNSEKELDFGQNPVNALSSN